MRLQRDGLLVETEDVAEGRAVIAELCRQGFKYGRGDAGRGLYSPTWDRQVGEWGFGEDPERADTRVLLLNPSMLAYLEVREVG